jgi:pSer/pThr/pTyr-binding forkhead associated (FHA) protein
MAFVLIESGFKSGEMITIDKDRTVFGRHTTCDCVLSHPTVSREHFYIERNAGKLFLVDLGSNNGTFANESKISWVELKDGDKIQAGPFTLIFKSSSDEEAEGVGVVLPAPDDPRQETDGCRIYPRQYYEGIEHFNARRYYEAHEVWEEVWLRSLDETKLFYQMLIQAAVGLHHYENGNARGARGMYRNVLEKAERLPAFYMSVDVTDFICKFKEFFSDMIERNSDGPQQDRARPAIRLLEGQD